MLDWLGHHLWWITALSVAMFVGGGVFGVMVIVRMPADYFVASRQSDENQHRPGRLLRKVGMNLLGVILMTAGIVLSLPLVPGPGLLILLVGISLTDFPGKRKVEQWIIRKPVVLGPMNWLRGKFGREGIQLP